MNRAARRKAVKRGVTANDLQVIKENAKQAAIHEAVNLSMVASCMVLRDTYGFGTKRLQRFLEGVNELSDAIMEDYVTHEDCKQTLLEECGILFK